MVKSFHIIVIFQSVKEQDILESNIMNVNSLIKPLHIKKHLETQITHTGVTL